MLYKQFAKEYVDYPTRYQLEWYEKHKDEINMTVDEMRSSLDWSDEKKRLHKIVEKDWKEYLCRIADDFEKSI